ncbi:MAG: hypothetical protein ACK6D3_10165 [Planctomycetaceae bacterium]
MTSADGKGRTLFEMLTGRNKRDMTPQEQRVHTPLRCRVGTSVMVTHDTDLADLVFFIESIWVWETIVGTRRFYHTDYNLKARVIDGSQPVRLKLRLIPDEDIGNELGHRVQVLQAFTEFGWDFAEKSDFLSVLADPDGVFRILQDADGVAYDEADQPTYWRIDDVRSPYRCRVTILKDRDGDGTVQADELEQTEYLVWDYHRSTTSPVTGKEFIELLNVEEEVQIVDDEPECLWFTILIGREVEPMQITLA